MSYCLSVSAVSAIRKTNSESNLFRQGASIWILSPHAAWRIMSRCITFRWSETKVLSMHPFQHNDLEANKEVKVSFIPSLGRKCNRRSLGLFIRDTATPSRARPSCLVCRAGELCLFVFRLFEVIHLTKHYGSRFRKRRWHRVRPGFQFQQQWMMKVAFLCCLPASTTVCWDHCENVSFRKIFVGGLAPDTDERKESFALTVWKFLNCPTLPESKTKRTVFFCRPYSVSLQEYFEQYGVVTDSVVMRDTTTKRSRLV